MVLGFLIEPEDCGFRGDAGGGFGDELFHIGFGEGWGAPVGDVPGDGPSGPGEEGGDEEGGGEDAGGARQAGFEEGEEVGDHPGGEEEKREKTGGDVAGEDDAAGDDDRDEDDRGPAGDEEERAERAAADHPDAGEGDEEENGGREVEVEPAVVEGMGGVVGPPLGLEMGAGKGEADEILPCGDGGGEGGMVGEDGFVEARRVRAGRGWCG